MREVEYDLAAESLLYASADTGYHAGGFAFAEIKPTYNAEYLTAYSGRFEKTGSLTERCS